MSGPLLTIVVPTVDGREQWLERCLASYFATTPDDTQILVYRNRATCGIAWNEGIAEAIGAYVHLTADDIEAHPGWWKPAISATDLGWLPAPRILNGDGSLQSCGDADEQPDGTECEIARIPFASRAQLACIGPMAEWQYYGDNWFSHRGRACGYPSIVVRDYLFTHHLAGEGRIDTLAADGERFFKARGKRIPLSSERRA